MKQLTFQNQVVLQPNNGPGPPGEGWSVDLATNLEPEYDSYSHCVVTVDCLASGLRSFHWETNAQQF